MKKEERIERYGKAAYEKRLNRNREYMQEWRAANHEEATERARDWYAAHPEKGWEGNRKWREANPQKVRETHREMSHKGGKYYEQRREHLSKGVPHEKGLLRQKHAYLYAPYKRIIAPESQIHHEWVAGTADYRGVALVEKDQHMHGFIDVIQVLDGDITLLTEKEIRKGGM